MSPWIASGSIIANARAIVRFPSAERCQAGDRSDNGSCVSSMGPASFDATHLLEVDARGRTSLARLGGSGRRYLARTEPNGTIVLEPAVVMTELEARLHANPELHAQVTEAAAHPERAVAVARTRRRKT